MNFRKWNVLFAAFLLANTVPVYASAQEAGSYRYGDVNYDGVVNGKDITLIRRYLAGGFDLGVFNKDAADADKNDSINGKDATLIRRYLSGGFGVMLEEIPQQSINLPWENGGKMPPDYSYAEYEALTDAQQMAFQDYFDSVEAFDAWLESAQNGDFEDVMNPWEEPGAKQSHEYTYDEFTSLTASQQMAFQAYFDSAEAFDAWLESTLNGDSEDVMNPWEVPGAKQPNEYTYAEFNSLTASQQMAFQAYFDSAEAFDAWLESALNGDSEDVMNPWEVTGAKQPAEYTYDEFNNLTPGQQMAFQKYLGEEAFDAWLNANLPQ